MKYNNLKKKCKIYFAALIYKLKLEIYKLHLYLNSVNICMGLFILGPNGLIHFGPAYMTLDLLAYISLDLLQSPSSCFT